MRPSPLRWLLASVIMLSPLPALAQATAYVSAWDTLYRLDLATGQASRIGNGIGFNDVEGLAISPQGILYGVADGTVGSGSELTDFLVRIDTTTGAGTLVGALSGLSGPGPEQPARLRPGLHLRRQIVASSTPPACCGKWTCPTQRCVKSAIPAPR